MLYRFNGLSSRSVLITRKDEIGEKKKRKKESLENVGRKTRIDDHIVDYNPYITGNVRNDNL